MGLTWTCCCEEGVQRFLLGVGEAWGRKFIELFQFTFSIFYAWKSPIRHVLLDYRRMHWISRDELTQMVRDQLTVVIGDQLTVVVGGDDLNRGKSSWSCAGGEELVVGGRQLVLLHPSVISSKHQLGWILDEVSSRQSVQVLRGGQVCWWADGVYRWGTLCTFFFKNIG